MIRARKSCLSRIATLVTIVAGFLSIISFFFADADSFLQASSNWLDGFLPRVSFALSNLEVAIEQFVHSYPAALWVSAIAIILITALISLWIEIEYLLDNPLYTLLLLSPLAFVWIWVFSGVVSTFGIVLFISGFFLSIFIFPLLDFFGF